MVTLVRRRSSNGNTALPSAVTPVSTGLRVLLPPHRPGRLRSRAEAAGTGPAAGQRGPAVGRLGPPFLLFPARGAHSWERPRGAPPPLPRRDPSLLSRRRLDMQTPPVCGGAGLWGFQGLLYDAGSCLQTVRAGPWEARLPVLSPREARRAALSARLSPPPLGFPSFSIRCWSLCPQSQAGRMSSSQCGSLQNLSWIEVKNPPANAGDPGLIPGSGRSPGEGHGYPLHCSSLENPMDRGAWRVTVHGLQSRTQLNDEHWHCLRK